MEGMEIIGKLRKIITQRYEDIVAAMTSGGVDNMEKYNYIVGQITALEATKQELSNLLEDKEQHGTVINIKDTTTE